MWYLLSFILAIVGAGVAMSGEPMGAIGFMPLLLILSMICDNNNQIKE